MTDYEQYAESLIEGYKFNSYGGQNKEAQLKNAALNAISDVRHTIEALEKTCTRFDNIYPQYSAYPKSEIESEITYYQQALTYLQNKLK